jgi:hypothetical protein
MEGEVTEEVWGGEGEEKVMRVGEEEELRS